MSRARRHRSVLVTAIFAVTVSGCGAPPVLRSTAPPPAIRPDVALIAAGDVLELDVPHDGTLQGWVRVGVDGTASIPYCGSVPLRGLGRPQAAFLVGSCLVRSRAYSAPPEVTLRIVRQAAHVTLAVDHGRVRRDVPMEPGLTLVAAFATTVIDPAGHLPAEVVLVRRGERYAVDVAAILQGIVSDTALEGGDVIEVEKRLALHPEPKSDAFGALMTLPAAPPKIDLGVMFCDEVDRAEENARGLGKDAHHADVVALAKARTHCKARLPSEMCAEAQRRKAELIGHGLGVNHPEVRVQDEILATCR